MPTVPAKGAVSCFWSSTACSLLTCEADADAVARAVSSVASVPTPRRCNSTARSSAVWSETFCAFAAARSARSTASSSCSSTALSATFWLAWNMMLLTMPAVSTVRSTPRTALTVPIASTPGVHSDGFTMTVETVAAGGFMVAKYCLIALSRNRLKATIPPHTTMSRSNIPTMMKKRFTNSPPRPASGNSRRTAGHISTSGPVFK